MGIDAADSLARQILTSVGARAVAIKMGQQRRMLASADLPPAIDRDIDMRTLTVWSAIVKSFETMLERGNQAIRIVGPAPGAAQFIEVVVDEKPLRQAMYRFSRNLLLVSLGIAMLAAGLVYLALHYLFVRPMRRLTANLVGFHENPESAARIIVPSQRGDEIGVAERGLSDMQRDTVVLDALAEEPGSPRSGLRCRRSTTICAIFCASSRLLSDQLAGVPDPRVQRFAPKLMRSLERAIDFCPVDAFLWPPRRKPSPTRRMILVRPRRDRGAPIRRPCRRRLDHLDRRGRARSLDRRRSRPAVSRAAQPGAQRRPGARRAAPAARVLRCRSASPAAREGFGRDHRGLRYTGPGVPAKAREHLFEAFQGSRPPRRQRLLRSRRSPPN